MFGDQYSNNGPACYGFHSREYWDRPGILNSTVTAQLRRSLIVLQIGWHDYAMRRNKRDNNTSRGTLDPTCHNSCTKTGVTPSTWIYACQCQDTRKKGKRVGTNFNQIVQIKRSDTKWPHKICPHKINGAGGKTMGLFDAQLRSQRRGGQGVGG